MRFPKHIADRDLAGNPTEIVRAAFTLYWATQYFTDPEEGSADGSERTTIYGMNKDINLLFQTGVGSVRELSRTYLETKELRSEVETLTTPQAFQLCQQVLETHFADLTPELSLWMNEFIKLINDRRQSKWTEHLRSVQNGWLILWRSSALGLSIVEALQDSFVPILRQECNLELYGNDLWVARNPPVESVGDVQLVRCCDFAGQVIALGHTNPETYPPKRVYLTEDYIDIMADCTAYWVNPNGTRTALDEILSLLVARLSLNTEQLADTFRTWQRSYTFWHELGHQEAHAWINSRFGDRQTPRLDTYFHSDVRELYADAFSLRKMEMSEDPAWRLYWMASHSQVLQMIFQNEPDVTKGETHWYAMVRALLSDDPGGYMDELIAQLEARRARPKQPSRAEWLRESLEKAKEESRMMLGWLLQTG